MILSISLGYTVAIFAPQLPCSRSKSIPKTASLPAYTFIPPARMEATIAKRVGRNSGHTPSIVVTWALERDEENPQSATRLVFKPLFFPSATPQSGHGQTAREKNEAAEQTFLRSLMSRKVTTGFQYLLQDTFKNAAASTIIGHDPSQILDPYYLKKLHTLSRAFGSLLKSRANEDSTRVETCTATSSKSPSRQSRVRAVGHLSIATLEPALWTKLSAAGDLQEVLAGRRMLGGAQKDKYPCVSRIMDNNAVWNGRRSLLRGYWENEDGTRVEIHPNTFGRDLPDKEDGALSGPPIPLSNPASMDVALDSAWAETLPSDARGEVVSTPDQYIIQPSGTAPTLRASVAFTTGTTPIVVYTGSFRKVRATAEHFNTALVIQAEYVASTSANATNAAARRTFLKGLNTKVVAGFQHTLNGTQRNASGTVSGFYSLSQKLDTHDDWGMKGLLHTFGNLLKTSIDTLPDRSTTVPAKLSRRRKSPRPVDHLAISPVDAKAWDLVTAAGDQHLLLSELHRSRVARPKSSPRVYRIMYDQEDLDVSDGPLRGYWTNADGSLLEMNPKDWVTGNEMELSSYISAPPERVATRSGDCLAVELPEYVGGEDDSRVDGGSGEVGTDGDHDHGVMSWTSGNYPGSKQPSWLPEETYDGVPENGDEAYIGSFYQPRTWADYLKPVEEYCQDHDMSI